jgi:uncharacterized protein
MKMSYKPSKYNILVKTDGSYLLFNSLRGSLAKIEKDKIASVKRFLRRKKITKLENNSLLNKLTSGGFVIPNEFDELRYLKLAHFKTKFNSENIELSIIVTKECNFTCTYCCENTDSTGYITEQRMARLVTFVREKAQKARALLISWFGGEPLMRFDVIEELTDHFTKICDKYSCRYAAFLTTNGYLLSPRVADTLAKLKIDGVQITLDGPQNIHNKRRMVKNGRGTYDIIVDNIRYIVKNEIPVKIKIRCNVDTENAPHLNNWLKNFPDDLKTKVNIYFAAVTPGGEENCPAKTRKQVCINEKNISLISKLMHSAQESGFSLDFKLGRKNVYCNADNLHHFVIGSDLSLIGCPYIMNTIGYITKGGKTVYELNKRVNWLTRDPFEDGELNCKACTLLPICGGGCNLARVVGGKKGCIIFKYNIKEWVRLWYRMHYK